MDSLVIYHDNCADGFGAAYAAWCRLGNEAIYYADSYNDVSSPNPKLEGGYPEDDLFHPGNLRQTDVYILDFSFDLETTKHLLEHAKAVVWLDHHKTAFEMWCGSYERGDIYEKPYDPRHYILLNDNKSGAMLAWEYFHPGTPVPKIIRHIDDRDRWQFKMEGSRELHAALMAKRPWILEDEEWQDYDDEMVERLINEGGAILQAHDQHAQAVASESMKCGIRVDQKDGTIWDNWPIAVMQIGLAVNCPYHLASDVGHILAIESDTYGLCWFLRKDGKVNCSLRSNGEYDVSEIAKAFGGGGHRNAAGFVTDLNTLQAWLKP